MHAPYGDKAFTSKILRPTLSQSSNVAISVADPGQWIHVMLQAMDAVTYAGLKKREERFALRVIRYSFGRCKPFLFIPARFKQHSLPLLTGISYTNLSGPSGVMASLHERKIVVVDERTEGTRFEFRLSGWTARAQKFRPSAESMRAAHLALELVCPDQQTVMANLLEDAENQGPLNKLLAQMELEAALIGDSQSENPDPVLFPGSQSEKRESLEDACARLNAIAGNSETSQSENLFRNPQAPASVELKREPEQNKGSSQSENRATLSFKISPNISHVALSLEDLKAQVQSDNESEAMQAYRQILTGPVWEGPAPGTGDGGKWRNRWRDRTKRRDVRRIFAQLAQDIAEGKEPRSPGGYAETLWKRWVITCES